MIVTGLQLDVAWEDPQENFRRAADLALRAAGGGARLIVLPEMFATGFSMRAEEMSRHAGATRDFLRGLAEEHGAFVLGGFAEPGEPRPRNACSLYAPDGEERLHYQKIHPFTLGGEPAHYSAGEALASATVEGLRVTPFICYDLRFPELFRAAAARTDLFVVIASWPRRRRDAWSVLLRARAIENQCFVLGVNRVGVVNGEPHSGDSALFDPFGAELAAASDVPALVSGEVDAAAVLRARAQFSFLADRRPDVYRRLDSGAAPPG